MVLHRFVSKIIVPFANWQIYHDEKLFLASCDWVFAYMCSPRSWRSDSGTLRHAELFVFIVRKHFEIANGTETRVFETVRFSIVGTLLIKAVLL